MNTTIELGSRRQYILPYSMILNVCYKRLRCNYLYLIVICLHMYIFVCLFLLYIKKTQTNKQYVHKAIIQIYLFSFQC